MVTSFLSVMMALGLMIGGQAESQFAVYTSTTPFGVSNVPYPIDVCVVYDQDVDSVSFGKFTCDDGNTAVTFTGYGQDPTCSTGGAVLDTLDNATLAAGVYRSFRCTGTVEYGVLNTLSLPTPNTGIECCTNPSLLVPGYRATGVCTATTTANVYEMTTCTAATFVTIRHSSADCSDVSTDIELFGDIELCVGSDAIQTGVDTFIYVSVQMGACVENGAPISGDAVCLTSDPTMAPSTAPTMPPTSAPTLAPNVVTLPPTEDGETYDPTMAPTSTPTMSPTTAPTMSPTINMASYFIANFTTPVYTAYKAFPTDMCVITELTTVLPLYSKFVCSADGSEVIEKSAGTDPTCSSLTEVMTYTKENAMFNCDGQMNYKVDKNCAVTKDEGAVDTCCTSALCTLLAEAVGVCVPTVSEELGIAGYQMANCVGSEAMTYFYTDAECTMPAAQIARSRTDTCQFVQTTDVGATEMDVYGTLAMCVLNGETVSDETSCDAATFEPTAAPTMAPNMATDSDMNGTNSTTTTLAAGRANQINISKISLFFTLFAIAYNFLL